MNDNNEFYVGYIDNLPPSTGSFLKKRLIGIFVSIPILVFLLVFFQKGFNNHFFSFGNEVEVTGILYTSPFPILISEKTVTHNNNQSTDILLVGYGKFGAMSAIEAMEKSNGKLEGKKVILSGTLLSGDGKIVMELTNNEKSLISVDDSTSNVKPNPKRGQLVELSGEIIDPKCYFGLMKPGEGKIHKSCAIRCISGGIPPVFRDEVNYPSSSRYLIMQDQNGNNINKEILPYVGEKIKLKGRTSQFSDWEILQVDLSTITYTK